MYEKQGHYDMALSLASSVVADNPGTALAAWGQCVVGTAMVKKGQFLDGVRTLLEVDGMLNPDNMQPKGEAERRVQDICDELLDETTPVPVRIATGMSAEEKTRFLTLLGDWLCAHDNADGAEKMWARLAPGQAVPAQLAAKILLVKARGLIGTKEEPGAPANALTLLDKIRTDYANTDAAKSVEFRRAEALEKLGRYDEAMAAAEAARTSDPSLKTARWADCITGTALVKTGRIVEGVQTLMKVEEMPPDGVDYGAKTQARGRLLDIAAECSNAGSVTAAAVGNLADAAQRESFVTTLAGWAALGGEADIAWGVIANLVPASDRQRVLGVVTHSLAEQDKVEQAIWVLEECANSVPVQPEDLASRKSDLIQVCFTAAGTTGVFRIHAAFVVETLTNQEETNAAVAAIYRDLRAKVDTQVADLYSSKLTGGEKAKAGFWLVRDLEQQSKFAQAMELLRSVVEIPDLENATLACYLYKLGAYYHRIGDSALATRYMNQLIETVPDSSYAGQAQEDMRKWGGADASAAN